METKNASIANFWGLRLQFFRVPKSDSMKCKLGFGLCFSIVIVFGQDGIQDAPIVYDPETDQVSFAA